MNTLKSPNQGSNAAVITLLVIIIIMLAAGGVWYFMNMDKSDKSNETNVSAPAADKPDTVADDKKEISERAAYIYGEYTPASGVNRYSDLEAKGYITANLVTEAKDKGFDSLTCSQSPAPSYSYDTPTIDGKAAKLAVAGNYAQSPTIITTNWVKEDDTWKIDKITCPAV